MIKHHQLKNEEYKHNYDHKCISSDEAKAAGDIADLQNNFKNAEMTTEVWLDDTNTYSK